MNPHEELKKICDTLNRELEHANEKISRAGGNITGDDLSYIDRLTHAIKSVKTTMAMMEAEDEGESGYYMPMYGRSYGDRSYGMRDGNSYARRRDSMGRYSRRGYAMDDDMMAELRELMADAPDERTRQEFQKFISKMESM